MSERKQDPTQPKPGETWLHHSGREYFILQPVYCADTGELMVMYRESPLFKNPKPISQKRYIHTVANFLKPGRFERVKS